MIENQVFMRNITLRLGLFIIMFCCVETDERTPGKHGQI